MELIEVASDWVKLDDIELLPTPWFNTHQIETWIDELNGSRVKLIIVHQCGENKVELISQLECMIHGVKTDFKDYVK